MPRVSIPASTNDRKKSRASKTVRVNPLSVTVASGAPSSVVEPSPQGPPSTQVTLTSVVPIAVPLPRSSKGVAIPVACVYKDGEDPEIEAIFEAFGPSQSADGALSKERRKIRLSF